MKFSAPIYILKHRAKILKRSQSISMVQALDQIAITEGFKSWDLLNSHAKKFGPETKTDILNYLNPGELVLIGARPGLGKTMLALELLIKAIKDERLSFFFSFEYTLASLIPKLKQIDESIAWENPLLNLDFSDAISADYIIDKTQQRVNEGSIIVIDYLQLLDQQRHKPAIQTQIESLKAYAQQQKCIFLFVSQIDKGFDLEDKKRPSLSDIRCPNPLDLTLFDKTIFVHNEQIYFEAA